MTTFKTQLSAQELHGLGILAIAQVGDAAYELMVRTRLCLSQPTAGKLHRARVHHVNAAAQAKALQKIMPLLHEDELEICRRGRNAQVTQVPKSVTREEYMSATALESVWGYLYLTGQTDRLSELFEVIWI